MIPSPEIITDSAKLYIAIGILGATVMPHNLYLHSAIVQTRSFAETEHGRKEAIKYSTLDSTLSLLFALLVNGAILVLAAAVFHASGHTEIAELPDAQALLAPLLGTALAGIAFAIALLACGLNSTVTATLAGQVVMEGFLRLQLPLWLRRLVTRLLAIVPALLVTVYAGANGAGQLLVFSQVILSLQLPFAMIPLLRFVGDRRKLGTLALGRPAMACGWLIAAAILGANGVLLYGMIF